jgi:RNA polymerase sigma-B factor
MATATIAERIALDPARGRRTQAGAESAAERRLLRCAHAGDPSARDELIRHFTPLAHRLASRYRATGESRDDLEQVACLGLIKAIDGYDPDRGPFSRYAVPTILGELKRHFRDKGWTMRVPRSLQERFLNANEAMDALSSSLGRSPTARDVAERTGYAVDEVVEALDAGQAYAPAALDAPFSGEEGERTLGDTIGSEDKRFELVELGQAVLPAFRSLPHRQRLILSLRFYDDLTQSEIADRIGISQMHVSRLLRRSLKRLETVALNGDEAATS